MPFCVRGGKEQYQEEIGTSGAPVVCKIQWITFKNKLTPEEPTVRAVEELVLLISGGKVASTNSSFQACRVPLHLAPRVPTTWQ